MAIMLALGLAGGMAGYALTGAISNKTDKNDAQAISQDTGAHAQFASNMPTYFTSATPTEFTTAAEKCIDGVVHVKTMYQQQGSNQGYADLFQYFFGMPDQPMQMQPQQASGSGVIISKDGYMGRRDGGPLRTQGGYWGTACANHDTGEILLTQKYYAFGQFSRYIRPGSTLILCPTDRRSGVKALAAKNKKQLTIVCTNTTAQDKEISLDLSDFKVKGQVKQIRTSGQFADGEHWAETDLGKIKEKKLETVLAPNSVTTFVISL